MKKIVIILILCFCGNVFGQNKFDREQRKGSFYFSISPEYRITPIFGFAPRSNIGRNIEVNEQNSGVALSYAFDWFILKNLSLGFSHSFRYDHIVKGELPLDSQSTIAPDTNGLIMDFHFYVKYHLKLFKDSEVSFLLGRSLLNTGTSFSQINRFFDTNGEIILGVTNTRNANYGAFHFGVGWKKNRVEILGGVYTSNTTEYFGGSIDFTVPYIKLNYSLGKL